MKKSNRRDFLRTVGTTTLAGAFPLAANLSAFNANAAETSGYKALVCVFFFGGMDGHDLIIPYDQNSYNTWASIRAPLLNIGGDNGYGGTRDRSRLLPLTGAGIGGREFALTEETSALHELFLMGDASVVANTGPLIEPINRQAYIDRSGTRPPRLFSHNDQQSVWQSFQPEGAPAGWGGRFADMMLASNANPNATFTAISASGTSVFLQGDLTRPFQLGRNGAVTIRSAEFRGAPGFAQIYQDHIRGVGSTASNLFERDMQDNLRFGVDANVQLDAVLESEPVFSTAFPDNNNLASQLSVVARIISQRAALDVGRQVFFVSMGGFDTHSNQPTSLSSLQTRFSTAIRSFYDTTVELGIQNEVTLFTSSDFGRTLQVNGDGTDHGWGNHHLVVGGAVNGGNIEGAMPDSGFDHDQDSGRGRLIPTSSVEQYAAALGRWFGLSDIELQEALPGLNNFDINQLGGLFL